MKHAEIMFNRQVWMVKPTEVVIRGHSQCETRCTVHCVKVRMTVDGDNKGSECRNADIMRRLHLMTEGGCAGILNRLRPTTAHFPLPQENLVNLCSCRRGSGRFQSLCWRAAVRFCWVWNTLVNTANKLCHSFASLLNNTCNASNDVLTSLCENMTIACL